MLKKRIEMYNKYLLITEKEIDATEKDNRENLFSLLIIRQEMINHIKEMEEKQNDSISNKK